MDIAKIIDELRTERNRLDGIIAALERLGGDSQNATGPKRRGRKFMDKAGRLEVSERMKRYWDARRHSSPYANAPAVAAKNQVASASDSGASS